LFLAKLVEVFVFNFEAIGQVLLDIPRPQYLLTIWSFDLEKFVQGQKNSEQGETCESAILNICEKKCNLIHPAIARGLYVFETIKN
jgi:hypothetical protein